LTSSKLGAFYAVSKKIKYFKKNTRNTTDSIGYTVSLLGLREI
jgi:hypothetical protein